MTVAFTKNFLANSRGFTFLDGGGVTWSFNANTNSLTATASGSGGGTGANPSASVGLAAVNGSATTFLRSDGAPALSQAISPTWTAPHVFQSATGISVAITGTSTANTAALQITGATPVAGAAKSSGIYIFAGGDGTDRALDILNSGSTRRLLGVFGDGSIVVGGPTGGLLGAGNINVDGGYYVNGVAIASANVTADTHPATANAADDEFEVGSTLDTAGTRRSGAIAWTLKNPTPTTALTTVAGGAIVFGGANQGINNETVAVQAITSPSGSWDYRCKQLGVSCGSTGLNANQPVIGGLFLGIGSTGQGYYFFRYTGQPTWVYITTQVNYTATGGTVNVIGTPHEGLTNLGDFFSQPMYFRVSFNASTTKLTFYISYDGILWVDVFDTTISSAYVTPDSIGLCVCSNTNDAQQVAWDWFRRTV